MKTIHELLHELDACSEATQWAEQYSTIEEIVQNVHRGDWLLWLAQKVGVELKPLILAKVNCAKTVIHLMKDERSLKALEVAEKFALTDDVSLDDLRASRNTYVAADVYTDAYAVDAYAADAAAAATLAAAALAAAAIAAVDVANAATLAAAATTARTENRIQTADICRRDIGGLIIELVNKKLV